MKFGTPGPNYSRSHTLFSFAAPSAARSLFFGPASATRARITTAGSMASPSWCSNVTPSVVSQWLGGRSVRSLAFRNARELDQSNVVVVVPSSSEEEEDSADTSPSALPPLLLKRTCIAWLQQRVVGRSAEKWAVSLRSFAAEQHFYALAPVDELARAGGGGRLPALALPQPHPLLGLHHGPRAPPDPLALRRAPVL
jgi:hypothetical protein